MTDPAIRDHVSHCWRNGYGLGSTCDSVRRILGAAITAEEVRLIFLRECDIYLGVKA